MRWLIAQVDGEPWMQAPARMDVTCRGHAYMLRRIASQPLARMAHAVAEVLEGARAKGLIDSAQHHALTAELAARMHPDF